MKKISLLSLLSLLKLALSHGAKAQQVPAAGRQLQQLAPTQPPAPQLALPEIPIEESATPTALDSDAAKVLVKTMHLTGTHVFLETKLLDVAGFVPESQLSLADLQVMAKRITKFYRSHGYFVARALLGSTKVTDNVVTITVREGRYGNITMRNTSNLSSRHGPSHLDGLNSGDPTTIKPLENRLLPLSDTTNI